MTLGPLIIVSGPSGAGKSTVVERLLKDGGLPLHQSVSVTTRQKRGAEEDGKAYHFWTRQRFEEQIQAGAFVEWAEVHGAYYGTLRSEIDDYRARGIGVILVIDVQGAAQVRPQYPDVLDVFLQPPSLEELERRLRGRGDTAESAIQRRLTNARAEMARAGEYKHCLVGGPIASTVAELRKLIAQGFTQGEENAR